MYYSISLESYPYLNCHHPNIKNYSNKKKKGKSFCVSKGSELTLAQVIKAHREGEGWTLEEAAQKLGMSRQALHQYESGAGLPSIEQTIRLANGLGAMPDMWLIYRIEAELRNQGMDYKVILKRRA
jgi:DNA-binding XRE family transcriptional regulator